MFSYDQASCIWAPTKVSIKLHLVEEVERNKMVGNAKMQLEEDKRSKKRAGRASFIYLVLISIWILILFLSNTELTKNI